MSTAPDLQPARSAVADAIGHIHGELDLLEIAGPSVAVGDLGPTLGLGLAGDQPA